MRDRYGKFIKGHIVPKSFREKASMKLKGKPSPMKGKKHSSKIRQKIRDAVKGKMVGNKNPNWKNGEYTSHGYIMVNSPNHPLASCRYVRKHRLIMEKHLGRYLTKDERVHHINGDRSDNRIENLQLFNSHSEHSKYHYPKGSKFGIHLYYPRE